MTFAKQITAPSAAASRSWPSRKARWVRLPSPKPRGRDRSHQRRRCHRSVSAPDHTQPSCRRSRDRADPFQRLPQSRPVAGGRGMVVGAGSSGVRSPTNLRAGKRVYLSVGPHDRPPRSYRGRDFVWWLGALGMWDAKTPRTGHGTCHDLGQRCPWWPYRGLPAACCARNDAAGQGGNVQRRRAALRA